MHEFIHEYTLNKIATYIHDTPATLNLKRNLELFNAHPLKHAYIKVYSNMLSFAT